FAPASVNVLNGHYDTGNSDLNSNEARLTPALVSSGALGRLFGTTVDGQVYAQPLVETGVTIATGPNTVSGAAGGHDIVLGATENDSWYAIDARTGATLWRRSFLDAANPNNNTLNATAITAVPTSAVGSTDISPHIGITGTPVIDPGSGILYVVAGTAE